jgi:hypothetical protein
MISRTADDFVSFEDASEQSRNPEVGSVWTHQKSGVNYKVKDIVKIEATGEIAIAYRKFTNEVEEGWVFIRPLREWHESVSVDSGPTFPRFVVRP